MTKTLAAVLFFLPAATWAQCERDVSDTVYPTVEIAVIVALGTVMHFGGTGEKYGDFVIDASKEYGGYVIERPTNKFFIVRPVPGSFTGVHQCIIIPHGAKLAALFHTHTGGAVVPGYRNIGPSPLDKRNADRLNVPSFVGIVRDGAVMKYDPKTRMTVTLGTLNVSGEKGLWFPVTNR